MTDAAIVSACALVGFAAGLAYFALVRRTARQLAAGEMHVAGVVGSVGLRMLLFAPGAAVTAMVSLGALAGYMGGFLVARLFAVRRWGR